MWNTRQFILYTLVLKDSGKYDKVPINPITKCTHDAHDPSIWVSYKEALDLKGNCGVGFVFTERDPYFFIDVDDCFKDGVCSQIGVELYQQFYGCYTETSYSQKGFHIIGRYSSIPNHGKRNEQLGLEMYSRKRFVALTGYQAQGDVNFDATIPLQSVAIKYFPARASVGSPDWTDEPVPEWNGPEDDNELIAKMLASQSALATLGARASITDLWAASDNLGNVFPDSGGQNRSFDWSKADAALCQHLAFWTGKNCERMDRLFRMSALYRDKWEDREDYRNGTILHAVSLCTKVYSSGVKHVEGPGECLLKEGFQFLSVQSQIEYFKGCVYVRDLHKIRVPDGALLKPDQFKIMYGGYLFSMDLENDKTTKSAFEAFTESRGYSFPKAVGICFRPELTPGMIVEEEDLTYVNLYVPVNTPRKVGDPSRFINHLKLLVPNDTDREILLTYIASLIQNPGIKFQWWPVIQGVEGNGKSLLATIIAYCVGWRYTHFPNAKQIADKFNLWLSGKLFVAIDEIKTDNKYEMAESVKTMITNQRIEVQGKGDNQIMGENKANGIMLTNYKDAIPRNDSSRRYSMVFTAQQTREDMIRCGMGGSYFPDLYEWLRGDGFAIINNFLREYKPNPLYDPAGMCQWAPDTSSTGEAINLSRNLFEQEIMEAIDEEKPGFRYPYISGMALDRLIKDRGLGKISYARRRDALGVLGYIPHPHLRDGRSSMLVPQELGKPRIFVLKGKEGDMRPPGDIVNDFIVTQGYGSGV